jgi:tetratricopeptide (TPR) repeat protein
VDGDRWGAIAAAMAVLVGAATGHPLLGVIVDKGARLLATAAVDTATQRFLEAEQQVDEQRARVQAFQHYLLDMLGPFLEALQDRDDERFLQLLRYLDRNVASADGQAQLHEDHTQLRAQLQEIKERMDGEPGAVRQPSAVPFEGPGRVTAKHVRFFSAEEELEELRVLLTGDKSAVCIVAHGMGGVGKTTLAKELVARYGRELFPEGVAWLDADDLAVDMPRVSRLYGYGGDRDFTLEESHQWLCNNLHPRRVLLVFDNVAPDRINLHQLPVPGGECRTLLTSRDVTLHQKLDEVSSNLNLEEWPLDRCRIYLRTAEEAFRKESDADLDALSTFVGALPLALHLLAVHPSMSRETSARELLTELQATPIEVLDRFVSDSAPALSVGVVKTFQAAWLSLSQAEQIVLCSLCVCARGTRTEIVAATAEIEETETARALNRLADVSLAQYRRGAGAPWTLHDVVRLFVNAQGDTSTFEARHQRWVEQHMAKHADPTHYGAFEHAVPEGVVVVERLLEKGNGDEAGRVFYPLYRHLTRRGEYAQVVALGHRVLDGAPDQSAGQAQWLGRLGLCYQTLGDIPKAIELHKRSLQINEKLGNLEGQSIGSGNLGLCYFVRSALTGPRHAGQADVGSRSHRMGAARSRRDEADPAREACGAAPWATRRRCECGGGGRALGAAV